MTLFKVRSRKMVVVARNFLLVVLWLWGVRSLDLEKALEVAFKAATLIHVRFDMGNPQRVGFFLIAANMPKWGFDIIKLKVARKIVLGALNPERQTNETFTMVFGGSSVTAGHDNYYNQSYPLVAERRMTKAFEALGILLRVRNIAMGSNNCLPYDHCYNAQGGDYGEIDWLSWEQSFNCGKANGIYETMMRVAAFNKAVVYYVASGGFMPTGCAPSNDTVPWIMEHWTPELDNITSRYTPSRNATAAVRDELHQYYMEGNSVTRFTAPFWPHYNGVAPHGFSIWAKGPKGTPFDYHGPCHELGGPHWMVHETAEYGAGHGAHHHPTWGMHLLRGDTVAFWMLHAVIAAIYEVQDGIAKAGGVANTATLTALAAEYQTQLDSLQTPIPTKGMQCSPDCDGPIRCHTDFEPHYNPKAKISALFVNPDVKQFGWEFVSHDDKRTFPQGYRNGPARATYADFKVFWEAVRPDAQLNLRVVIGNTTSMRLCSYGQTMALRYVSLMLRVNAGPFAGANYTCCGPMNATTTTAAAAAAAGAGAGASIGLPVPWPHRHVGDECRLLEKLPQGDHVLTLLVNPNVTVKHRIALTHVIMFA